jgi:hypothetical protein
MVRSRLEELLGFLAEFFLYVAMLLIVLLRPRDAIDKLNKLLEKVVVALVRKRK